MMSHRKRKLLEKREVAATADKRKKEDANPYLAEFRALSKTWPADMPQLFSAGLPQARRQVLWNRAVEEASAVSERYAWAIPDARALRILSHFGPVIEIGAGAGYWAHLMREAGVDCVAFDKYPPRTADGELLPPWGEVLDGGPEQLALAAHAHRSLFLCYPDDYEDSTVSLARECLQAFQGSVVIHVGELFGDTPMINAAPWGRTSGPDFQMQLFSTFRCLLKVPLPRWPVSGDYLTVWRRCETCTVQIIESDDEPSGAHEADDAIGKAAHKQAKTASTKAGSKSVGKVDGTAADKAAASTIAVKLSKRKSKAARHGKDAAAAEGSPASGEQAAVGGEGAGEEPVGTEPRRGCELWDGDSDPYELVPIPARGNDDSPVTSDADDALPRGMPAPLALSAGRAGGPSPRLAASTAEDWDGLTDPHALMARAEAGEDPNLLTDDEASGSRENGDGDAGSASEGEGADAGGSGEEWDGDSDPYGIAGKAVGGTVWCGKRTRFEDSSSAGDDEDEQEQRNEEEAEGDGSGSESSGSDSEYEFVCSGSEFLSGAALHTADGFAVPSLQHLLRP